MAQGLRASESVGVKSRDRDSQRGLDCLVEVIKATLHLPYYYPTYDTDLR